MAQRGALADARAGKQGLQIGDQFVPYGAIIGAVVDMRSRLPGLFLIRSDCNEHIALAACTDPMRAIEAYGTRMPCIFNIKLDVDTDTVIASLPTDEEKFCAEAMRAERDKARAKYEAAENKKAFKEKIKQKILDLVRDRSKAFIQMPPNLKTVTIHSGQYHFFGSYVGETMAVYMTALGCVAFPMEVTDIEIAPIHAAPPCIVMLDSIMACLITHSPECEKKVKRHRELVPAETRIMFQPQPNSIVFGFPPEAFVLSSIVPAQFHFQPPEAFLEKLMGLFSIFGDVELVKLPEEARHPDAQDIIAFKGATAKSLDLPGEDSDALVLSPKQIFAQIHKHSDYLFKTVIGADEVHPASVSSLPVSRLVQFFLNCYPQWDSGEAEGGDNDDDDDEDFDDEGEEEDAETSYEEMEDDSSDDDDDTSEGQSARTKSSGGPPKKKIKLY